MPFIFPLEICWQQLVTEKSHSLSLFSGQEIAAAAVAAAANDDSKAGDDFFFDLKW